MDEWITKKRIELLVYMIAVGTSKRKGDGQTNKEER